ELSKKVSVVHDPSITARGSNLRHMVRVEVHLKNGTTLEQTVEAPRGSEQSFRQRPTSCKSLRSSWCLLSVKRKQTILPASCLVPKSSTGLGKLHKFWLTFEAYFSLLTLILAARSLRRCRSVLVKFTKSATEPPAGSMPVGMSLPRTSSVLSAS